MNETRKTVTLITIAVAVLLIAWVSRPGQWSGTPNKVAGEKLTADFDPLSAASLEIVEYDETTATIHPFQVAVVDFKGKRRWSIPSHSDYPADADKQVAGAATALMGLKILNIEGDTKADHEKFGVVDPDPKTLKSGATGVGMRVTIRDQGGKDLLSLVIGKEVSGQPGLRYIRRTGQDPIYTAIVNTANLTTQFDRWIEKDILKMNAWDLHRLWLRDYSTALSMDLQGQMGLEKENRGEIILEYNDQGEQHWKLVEDRKVNPDGTFSPNKMAEGEELNTAKIDELKNALVELKIVDVARKPEGISADLKASADFMTKKEAILTLAQRGFIVAMKRDGGEVELYSKEGEVRAMMKDGVEYVLRFGEIAADSDVSPAKQDEKDKEQKEGQDKDAKKSILGKNRYLFVMAEFNPDLIAKPQLEPLPEAKPAVEDKPAAETKEAAKMEEKSAEAKDAPAEDKPAEKSAVDSQREQIEKENKRKQDEYEEKLAAGKKHAEDLNARFADWYYIISDDVYRKIRVGHDEIVKKKGEKNDQADAQPSDMVPPLPAGPVSDFNNLQQQGPGGE